MGMKKPRLIIGVRRGLGGEKRTRRGYINQVAAIWRR